MILNASTYCSDKLYQMPGQRKRALPPHRAAVAGAPPPRLLLLLELALVLWVLAAGPGAGTAAAQQEQFNTSVHRRLSGLTEARAPEVIDGRVLLTYDGSDGTRYVAAAFAHEGYSQLHPFSLVENPVRDPDDPSEQRVARIFALSYPIPEDVEELEYRIIVDGLWQTDPTNPETVRDPNGVPVSSFSLPERPAAPEETPRVSREERGRVEFVFEAEPGREIETVDGERARLDRREDLDVRVAGSFNNWDPFSHRLRESEPGVYRLNLRVPEGRNEYYLVVEGHRVLDPENDRRIRHRDGFRVCTFSVP
ncbi:MAG: hypothetical protein ACOCXE_05495 [Spirochaetota bacterium]